MDEIGIVSYNCNGLADSKKRRTIFSWLKAKKHIVYKKHIQQRKMRYHGQNSIIFLMVREIQKVS